MLLLLLWLRLDEATGETSELHGKEEKRAEQRIDADLSWSQAEREERRGMETDCQRLKIRGEDPRSEVMVCPSHIEHRWQLKGPQSLCSRCQPRSSDMQPQL